jgi:hypothetical protein
MKTMKNIKDLMLMMLFLTAFSVNVAAQNKTLYYYGSIKNDLYIYLKNNGFAFKTYPTPAEAVKAAPSNAGLLLLGKAYPQADPQNSISLASLKHITAKKLRVYLEYPAAYPQLDLSSKPLETQLERGVVTSDIFGSSLPRLALLGIHNCHILPVKVDSPLIVLAKVVGVDKAELGLDSTATYPLLFRKDNVLISTTALSNFKTGRYGPKKSVMQVLSYIVTQVTGSKNIRLKSWKEDVRPAFGPNEPLPETARLNSIKEGVEWFSNGRFYVHPEWKADWIKYGAALKPVGPPVSQSKPNGDGSLGIIEGHTSTIYYDGSQQYRYWMRADVQGEASMALAAAGALLNNEDFKTRSANLIDYMFHTSNLRSGPKNDPNSPAYGLIGWATSNAGTFYGDDNSRAILGALAAAAYLKNSKWDKELAEAIMANFRTTGKEGFRGERLEEADIIRNGWPYYYNRSVIHPSPHFESWMWALYLWLYDKTGYEPLLSKTKEAIRITMANYPEKWKWGSSLQTQRARMILPLAWLLRLENTDEHRRWLDLVADDMLKNQVDCGAIREELGKGKGMFKELKHNSDYGSDEGSLITMNGQEISCMLYTNNFALFSLHEAAMVTGDKKYSDATNRLADFLVRVQVRSEKHKDLDGAWFRAFDYGKWDYWASNSDAGWGAWCTLTGWIQSWIVTSQVQIQQQQSFWDITKNTALKTTGKTVVTQMMTAPQK